MKHWVRVKYDYGGDPLNNHAQEIKTCHYYRENDDGTILHVNAPVCINTMGGNTLPYYEVHKGVTQEEFNKILKDSVDYLGINITNHKFIKDGKK
jgi:hypothetical protein